jgi:mRNA-degrading endonuclease RelE of RelBE toxin-antitoxin system
MSESKNEICYDRDFLKDTRALPAECQEKLAECIEILREDIFDSRLHTKSLSAPLQKVFSFRITRDYRVGFKFRASHVIMLLAVDRRDTIYKRLERENRKF